ncbi:MAG TPA: hypothetical protein VMU83_17565 [Hanamia sp.]|nr:hypothetical protein [Hanamia sp.]
MLLRQYDIECIQSARNFIDAGITKHYTIREIAEYAGSYARKPMRPAFGTHLFVYTKCKLV